MPGPVSVGGESGMKSDHSRLVTCRPGSWSWAAEPEKYAADMQIVRLVTGGSSPVHLLLEGYLISANEKN